MLVSQSVFWEQFLCQRICCGTLISSLFSCKTHVMTNMRRHSGIESEWIYLFHPLFARWRVVLRVAPLGATVSIVVLVYGGVHHGLDPLKYAHVWLICDESLLSSCFVGGGLEADCVWRACFHFLSRGSFEVSFSSGNNLPPAALADLCSPAGAALWLQSISEASSQSDKEKKTVAATNGSDFSSARI